MGRVIKKVVKNRQIWGGNVNTFSSTNNSQPSGIKRNITPAVVMTIAAVTVLAMGGAAQ
jgi:hypothetical protein